MTKTERNAKIFKLRTEKEKEYSWNRLGNLFNISPQRAKRIFDREAKKKQEKTRREIKFKNSKL